jgi:hypothetical protein
MRADNTTQKVVANLIKNLSPEALYHFVAAGHQVPPGLTAKETLPLSGRALRVLGDLFQGIAVEKNMDKKYVSWIAALGSAFSLLVGLSFPGGLPDGIFRKILPIIYGFEVFLIATGIVTTHVEVTRYGGVLLALTVVLHMCVMLMRLALNEHSVWRYLVAMVIAVTAILGAAGVDSIFGLEIVKNLKALSIFATSID